MIHLLKSLLIHAVVFGCVFWLSSSFAQVKKEENVQTIRLSTSVVQESVEESIKKTAEAPKPKTDKSEPVKQVQKKKTDHERQKIEVKPVITEAPVAVSSVVSQAVSEVAEVKETVSAPVSSGISVAKAVPVQVAEPTEAEVSASYRQANLHGIQAKIKNKLVYPMIARKNGWAGRTEVVFRLEKDGSVKNIRIAKSSGFNILDSQAVEAVSSAAPFAAPPRPIELTLPVTFNLL